MREEPVNGFEIVRYRPELKNAVVELWRDAFDAEAFQRREYLEWKYERNPYLPEPILFVALDGNGGVVGTRGFHGTQWHTPDEKIVIPCAEDFTIAADHRNTGLATAIMRFALDDLEQRGYEYVMSASGGQVTVLHSLAMGWKSLGAMEPVARLAWGERARHGIHQRSLQAVRRLWRPGRRSRTISRKLYRGGKTSFGRLDRVPRKPAADPRAAIVVSASPDPVALADVAGRRPFDGRIRHVRDPAFFEWRFENPSREYRFLLYELDGRLEGFMAIARYHSYHPPTLPFHIVDWEGSSHEVRLTCSSSRLPTAASMGSAPGRHRSRTRARRSSPARTFDPWSSNSVRVACRACC
ncbi:MAG: GNAT family N-acetyltransferase [Actinobacteria bacterium]|nr:GNAT family N-acetyltransferase [Actinomycetota bacterium]